MEIQDNSVSDSEAQANDDSSLVDVENTELSMNEENTPQEQSEQSESLPSTSGGKTVSEKENLPPRKRVLRLPLARIKHIMKMDPEVKIISQDTVFLVTKATELFLEYLGREAAGQTRTLKRKTMLKRDVDAAIESVANLCFLEGAMD